MKKALTDSASVVVKAFTKENFSRNDTKAASIPLSIGVIVSQLPINPEYQLFIEAISALLTVGLFFYQRNH